MPTNPTTEELLEKIKKLQKANQKLRAKVKLLEPLAIKYKQLKLLK
jgi:hypothetical protein